MKDAGKAVLGLVLLGTAMIILFLPFGRTYIPNIAHFFSEREGVWENARAAAYPEESLMSLNTLDDSVKVYRDPNGIPHIFASNQKDALMTLGYITAKDRLFQMMWNARLVSGQLHTWMGEDLISVDKAMLQLGMNDWAWSQHNNLSQDEYDLIKSYQRGINQYLNRQGGANGTLEYSMFDLSNRYWRPVDCLRLLNYWGLRFALDDRTLELKQALELLGEDRFRRYFDLSQSALQEKVDPSISAQPTIDKFDDLLSKMKSVAAGNQISLEATPIATGFNNTGNLGMNFQSGLQLPHMLYPVRISTPEFDQFGFTLPGVPLFVAGSSKHRAWVLRGNRDALSFKKVTTTSKQAQKYKFSHSDSDQDSLLLTLSSEGNPVWDLSNGDSLQLNWEGAQTQGLIHYTWMLGSDTPPTTKEKWPGYQLVQVSNNGMIDVVGQSENKSSPKALVDQITNDDNSLNVFSWRWKNERLKSVHDELQKNKSTQLIPALTDTEIPHKVLKPYILQSIKGKSNRIYFRLQNAIEEWDFSADRNSNLPVFFEYFMRYMRELIWDEVPNNIFPDDRVWVAKMQLDPNHTIFDIKETPEKESIYDLMLQAIDQALNTSQIEYGNLESWNWGSLTYADTKHASGLGALSPFSAYKVSREGYKGTINELRYRNDAYGTNTYFVSHHLGNGQYPSIEYMWTGGVSENPFSQFHHNGLDAWNNRTFTKFEWADSEDSKYWISKILFTPPIR